MKGYMKAKVLKITKTREKAVELWNKVLWIEPKL